MNKSTKRGSANSYLTHTANARGITLIALIITIIIMLILVAVSVRILINSNIIGIAEETANKTKTAYEEENDAMNSIKVGDQTLGEYLESLTPKEHNWKRNGDTLTCTCSMCTAENAEGKTLTIGEQLNYTKTGAASTTVSGEESGTSKGLSDGKMSTDDKLQADGSQTISRDAETKWVVLGREDSDKNGTYETLLLTTLTPTEDWFYMYGADAYNNAITIGNKQGVFDKACKELYGSEARSITIEDVNNCLEYTPAGGIYYNGSSYQITGNFTTKLSELGNTWTGIQNYNNTNKSGVFYTPEHPEGTTNANELGKYVLDGYLYGVSDDGTYLVEPFDAEDTSNTITEATRNLIFGEDYDYYYWLASRGVIAFYYNADFGPGCVSEDYAYSFYGTFYSNGGSDDRDYSLRAVVSLKSEIPASLGIPEGGTDSGGTGT